MRRPDMYFDWILAVIGIDAVGRRVNLQRDTGKARRIPAKAECGPSRFSQGRSTIIGRSGAF